MSEANDKLAFAHSVTCSTERLDSFLREALDRSTIEWVPENDDTLDFRLNIVLRVRSTNPGNHRPLRVPRKKEIRLWALFRKRGQLRNTLHPTRKPNTIIPCNISRISYTLGLKLRSQSPAQRRSDCGSHRAGLRSPPSEEIDVRFAALSLLDLVNSDTFGGAIDSSGRGYTGWSLEPELFVIFRDALLAGTAAARRRFTTTTTTRTLCDLVEALVRGSRERGNGAGLSCAFLSQPRVA